MKFAFEIPTKYLDTFDPFQDYLFCIAPQALNDTEYFNFYQKKAKEKYVILDNGAFELGESIPIKKLVDLAQALGVQEIVSPDIQNNAAGTVKRSVALFKYLEEKELLNDFNVMVAPQGRNMEEVLLCASKLTQLPATVFGIPARIIKAPTPYRSEQLRFAVLQKLIQQQLLRKKVVHLLGLCGMQFMKAYRKGQRYFRIRSIDTSFPVVLGITGKTFQQTKKKPTIPVKYDVTLSDETVERIKFNIKYLKAYR